MQITALQVFAFVVLLIGDVLIDVSIGTDYWSYYNYNFPSMGITDDTEKVIEVDIHNAQLNQNVKLPEIGHRGLFRYCYFVRKQSHEDVDAKNFIDDDSVEYIETCRNLFHGLINPNVTEIVAVEDKYVTSDYQTWDTACVSLMCISSLLGFIALVVSLFCCCCCSRHCWILSIFALLAALCSFAGIGVYAYHQQNDILMKNGIINSFTTKKDYFYWSFWVAVAGAPCQLLASILFAITRSQSQRYTPVRTGLYLKT